ncbi:hypothetical protein [Nostoc sp.]
MVIAYFFIVPIWASDAIACDEVMSIVISHILARSQLSLFVR